MIYVVAIPAALFVFITFLIMVNPGPTPDGPLMPWGERLLLTAVAVAVLAVFTLTPASAIPRWVVTVGASPITDAVGGFEQGRQDGATP